MANEFVHLELSTDDVKKARSFYKTIFDWTFEDMAMGPGMTYTMIKGAGTGGGMMGKQMPQQPTAWLAYVSVADLDKTVAKARKAGANVVVARQDIPGMGSLAVFIDPTGAALGLWEPAAKAAPAAKPAAKKAAKKPAAKKAPAKKAAKKK